MLKKIEMARRPIDAKALLRRKAVVEKDFVTYSEPGIYYYDGEPQIIYGKLPPKVLQPVFDAVSCLPFRQEERTTEGGAIGTKVDRLKKAKKEGLGESQIFGFRPPVPYGANYCGPAAATLTHAREYDQLVKLGKLLTTQYERLCPKEFERHLSLTKAVRKEWKISGTPFTSGIVNRNNSLRYHYDKGNIEGCRSGMVVLRKYCTGGLLSVPEFGAQFMLEDGAFFFFDGQKILHGVTPIYAGNYGYRYSIVFYALRKMMECGTVEEELARARKSKTETQKKRASKG